jgi:chromosome segregation ATPase
MSTPLLDAKTSLKKILSNVDYLESLNKDYIPKLKDLPTKLLEAIQSLEDEKSGILKTIDSNSNEINSYKNKISENQREVSKLEESNSELTQQRQNLMDKIQIKQNQLKATKDTIRVKNEEFSNRTKRLTELENKIIDLSRELNQFEDNLKQIEKDLENTFLKKERQVQNFGYCVQAMKILINKKYISSSLYQFIRALQVGSALDVKNILLAIDMREDQAIKILSKMLEENGPIEFDSATGTVTLKQEVDF